MRCIILAILLALLVEELLSALPPDCLQLEDGFYEHEDGCKDLYYKCLAGVQSSLACGSGLYFHQPSSSCVSDTNSILSCKCMNDGYQYVGDINSCVASNEGSATLQWAPAYEQCSANALAWMGSTDVYGRLVHIVNNDMSVAAKDSDDPSGVYFIGMKALTNSTAVVRPDYFWWLTKDNENALKPVLLWTEDLTEILDGEDVNDDNKFCMLSDKQRFKNKECHHNKDYICEYIYNKCEVSNPCVSPKVCVPDTQFKAYCVCPAGFPPTENCGVPSPCDANPCQNGGSCTPLNATHYDCACDSTYYGNDCQLFCDNTTVISAPCSRTCDYGVSYVKPASLLDVNLDQCFTMPYNFASCGQTLCEAHSSPEYLDCMSIGGFYTISSCYFVATSSSPIIWVDAWGLCEAQGATLAIIPDTDEAFDAMHSYILDKAPDQPVWIALKASTAPDGSSFGSWMSSETESLGVAVKDHDNQEGCVMIGHVVSDSTSDDGKRMMTMPCDAMPPYPPRNALCMKGTPYARFYTNSGHKLQVNPMWITAVSTERNAWMCGLACRRSGLCVAHAFQEASGTCELYAAKEGMPQTITSGANVTQVYQTIADSGWNLYNRLY